MRLGTFIIAMGLCSMDAAYGTTVYSQAPAWTPGNSVGSLWTSHVDAGGNGWRVFDNFIPNSSAPVNRASWYGVYLNSSLGNGSPNTTAWEITFYADNAGAPGAALSTNTLSSAAVTMTNLGTGTFGTDNNVTVYEFEANLAPYSFTPGTTYWFSPRSSAATFYDLFSMPVGFGGDNATVQHLYSSGNLAGTFVRGNDRAFTLSSVPEPSTYLLMTSGLAALALRRRRR